MDRVTARTAAAILRLLPRERISRAFGRLGDARVPRPLLDGALWLYARAFQVDLSEAIQPPGGYSSFNEFFTRRLKEGSRPVDPDPDTVISPADGRVDDAGTIHTDRTFFVKGQRYDTAALLGSADDASDFNGGHFAVVYLSPRDYHRVHAPMEGTIEKVRHIPGALFPVNDFGVRHVPLVFARNERIAIFLRSPSFGRAAIVMVGAMMVGKITLSFDGLPRPAMNGPTIEHVYPQGHGPVVARGDELGAFQLGSTVVLLLSPPSRGTYFISPNLIGTHVRFGQAIARRSNG